MTEPFPPLAGGTTITGDGTHTRQRRRKSSGLGADIRGDVDVPSFATGRRGTPPLEGKGEISVRITFL